MVFAGPFHFNTMTPILFCRARSPRCQPGCHLPIMAEHHALNIRLHHRGPSPSRGGPAAVERFSCHQVIGIVAGSRQFVPSCIMAQQITSNFLAVATTAILRRVLLPRQTDQDTTTVPIVQRRQLYRIFFYDCPPLSKKVHNPVTHNAIDFPQTSTATWRLQFHEEMKKIRKVALRLGYINERSGRWVFKPKILEKFLDKRIFIEDITDTNVRDEVRQKGVDMRIGLDIASIALKKQVDQIILVSGDSYFVPASKLARREGIDFVFDPMWASIRSDIHEHSDGLRTVFDRTSKVGAK